MKIKKTILAREILIFFGCIVLFLILWGAAALKNSYYSNVLSSLQFQETKAQQHLDNLLRLNKEGIKWNEQQKPDLYSQIATTAKFNEQNEQKIVIANQSLMQIQNKEKDVQQNIYNGWDMLDYLGLCSLIILTVAYLIRFSITTIIWALKNLRKENATTSPANLTT